MLTTDDEATLLYLVHDKEHIGRRGEKIPALDRAFRYLSEDGKNLWRGLYEQEVNEITKLLQFGFNARWTLSHYTSFTEHRCVAEKFGNKKSLLQINSIRGFPLCKWAIDLHQKMKIENPKEYEQCDGDFLIETCEKEAEWLLIMGTPLRIINVIDEKEYRIYVAERA